jgi:hypothetical protein
VMGGGRQDKRPNCFHQNHQNKALVTLFISNSHYKFPLIGS